MIRIQPIPPAPPELIGAQSAAAKELVKAQAWWDANGTMKGFKFAAYKLPPVVAALEKTFHGKCAYCEHRYDAGAPCDVEHYRPKGGVEIDGELKEPGYFWLAAEWTNLLPSCLDCNRARYHQFPDDVEEMRGKANMFPIGNPTKRARKPGMEVNEERLLLHPYFDDPAAFLTFLDEGAIQALRGPDGQPRAMAVASIAAYGLDRPNLTLARRDVWIRVAGLVKRAKRDLVRANAAPNDPEVQADLRDSIDMLKRELAERAAFLGMVRQLVEPVREIVK